MLLVEDLEKEMNGGEIPEIVGQETLKVVPAVVIPADTEQDLALQGDNFIHSLRDSNYS